MELKITTGGSKDRSLLRINIFSISCVFPEMFAKQVGPHGPRGGAYL